MRYKSSLEYKRLLSWGLKYHEIKFYNVIYDSGLFIQAKCIYKYMTEVLISTNANGWIKIYFYVLLLC